MIAPSSRVFPVLLIVFGGIATVLGVFAFSISGELAAFLIIFGPILLFTGISMNKAVSISRATEFVRYDEKTNTLCLNQRNPSIKEVVSLIADNDYTTSYEPEAINYTSVTVGGVTTGGAYKTGGYNYISSTKKNGLYRMTYGKNSIIDRIQLDDKLYALAKSSQIAQYLNDEKQIVVNDYNASAQDTQKMLYNLKTTGYVGNAFKCYPAYEKANAIFCWICDE